MPKLSERVRLVETDKLPPELSGFQDLALNERSQLVGIDEEGQPKRVSRVGELVIKLTREMGAAEPSELDLSPAALAIIEGLNQQNTLLQEQLDEMRTQRDALEQRLQRLEDITRELDGFRIGDPVAVLESEDEVEQTYESGYSVVGFSEENPEDIKVRNLDSDEILEVPSSILAHEEDLEDDEQASDDFTVGDNVRVMVDGQLVAGTITSAPSWNEDKGLWECDTDTESGTVTASVDDLRAWQDMPPPPPAETHHRLETQPRFMRRLRNRLPGAPEPPDYYVDEIGPYRLDDTQRIYVTEDEVRGRGIGGTALVAGSVLGIALWEFGLEKWLGFGEGSSAHAKEIIHNQSTIIHNQGTELHNLKQVNDHLTQVNGHLTTIDKELLHAHDHDRRMIQGLHNQVHRAAKHQDRIINDLRGDIARDHAQEMNSGGSVGSVHDKMQNTGLYWGVRYPWDWAANKVGSLKAEGWLHTLASRAQKHGHRVVWLHQNGKEVLKVDGTTNPAKVLSTLKQYQ